MQTGAEEGTLQEKTTLMLCGCLISTLYESSHTLYQISVYQILQTTLLTILPPPSPHPHNIKQSTLSVKGKGPVIPYPPSLQSIMKASHY